MFGFHFRYWAVEVIAEGDEPIGSYDGAEDDDDDAKPTQSSKSKRVEDSQQV